MKAISLVELIARQALAESPYFEFLREESMSVGLYVLPAGATDEQAPHTEDEVYVVLEGSSRFTAGTDTRDVGPGDVIFVPARQEHRFHDIGAELHLVVVFAPSETSLQS